MKHAFTAVVQRDGEWFIAWCPEIPGANGQGRTVEECRANLAAAIDLIRDGQAKKEPAYAPPSQQTDLINLFGRIDFDPSYNYKRQRSRR